MIFNHYPATGSKGVEKGGNGSEGRRSRILGARNGTQIEFRTFIICLLSVSDKKYNTSKIRHHLPVVMMLSDKVDSPDQNLCHNVLSGTVDFFGFLTFANIFHGQNDLVDGDRHGVLFNKLS